MSRYQIVLLGHEENLIQRRLDAIPIDHNICGIVVIGVNVLAIVEGRTGVNDPIHPRLYDGNRTQSILDSMTAIGPNPSSTL